MFVRTEQEIIDILENISEEKEMLNENPPTEIGEYTEMMDELEHIQMVLKWVLGEKELVLSF